MVSKNSDVSQSVLEPSKVFGTIDGDCSGNTIAYEDSDVMLKQSVGRCRTWNFTNFGRNGEAVWRRVNGKTVNSMIQSVRR